MTLIEFLIQIEKLGLKLRRVSGSQLKIVGIEIPQDVVRVVREHKPLILEYLSLCEQGVILYQEERDEEFRKILTRIELLESEDVGYIENNNKKGMAP